MIVRLLTGCVGLFQMLNGLAMILAPNRWYLTAPGVTDTGPYNAHFVIDVGLGFVAAGFALLLCAWRPQFKPVALGASGFVVFHALFHLTNFLHGHMMHAGVDIAVVIPALLGLVLVWPRNGEVK